LGLGVGLGLGLGLGFEHRGAAFDALDRDRDLEQACRMKAVAPGRRVCAKDQPRVQAPKNTLRASQVGAGLRDGDRDRIRAGATAGPVVRVMIEGRVRVRAARGLAWSRRRC